MHLSLSGGNDPEQIRAVEDEGVRLIGVEAAGGLRGGGVRAAVMADQAHRVLDRHAVLGHLELDRDRDALRLAR